MQCKLFLFCFVSYSKPLYKGKTNFIIVILRKMWVTVGFPLSNTQNLDYFLTIISI